MRKNTNSNFDQWKSIFLSALVGSALESEATADDLVEFAAKIADAAVEEIEDREP